MSPARKKKAQSQSVKVSNPPTVIPQWVIRYEESVLRDDLREVGHAAFDIAKTAINKKLKINPKQYGTNLHHPLHGFYKLKASHVRIAFHVQDAPQEAWVLMIGDRKSIWEKEQGEILARFEAEIGRHVIRERQKAKRR